MSSTGTHLLVIGASGLIGAELVRQARGRGLNVMGAARTPAAEANVALNLSNRERLGELLESIQPQSIAVCAGWPYVDGCEAEPDRSWAENVGNMQNLLDLAPASARLIYFSTDHVFGGDREKFFEEDPVSPVSIYARHKREVEARLLARGNALVIRTSWVFGVELRGKNFVYQVIAAARAGRSLKLPRGQAGCPTWSGWLAGATLDLLGESGIAHLTGDEPLTKAEWAARIIETLDLPQLSILEVAPVEAGQVAPRPQRVVLATRRRRAPHPDLGEVLARLNPLLLAQGS
jgi:dTDP-4-dehydrorhamnose reductase